MLNNLLQQNIELCKKCRNVWQKVVGFKCSKASLDKFEQVWTSFEQV